MAMTAKITQKAPKVSQILPAISSEKYSNLQEACDDFARFGSRVCKKISTLLEDTCELELLKPLVVMQSETDTEEKA